jgi:deferrochelatase/peroxidase EfeB
MGYAVPLGAHIRRMNPRDTAANIQRRRCSVGGQPTVRR